jgi:hypothetical protein
MNFIKKLLKKEDSCCNVKIQEVKEDACCNSDKDKEDKKSCC